jgi:hypothetical protein
VATPVEPCNDGSLLIAVNTLGCALFCKSSAFTIVVGVGASNPLEVMREPVTTISDTPGSAALLAAVGSPGDGDVLLPAAFWPYAGR